VSLSFVSRCFLTIFLVSASTNLRKVGDCTFADLTTVLKAQKSIQTDYPSTCNRPTIRMPNIEKDNSYEDWELIQFHFHVRSEHTFNGQRYDGEFHLVHQSVKTGKVLYMPEILFYTNISHSPSFLDTGNPSINPTAAIGDRSPGPKK